MDEKEFPKLLLQNMQDIAREIMEMRMERHKESPRGFLHGESSGVSHHWYKQPKVSQHSTMPTFLEVRNGGGGPQEQETLEDYFLDYESQYQRFMDNLNFQGSVRSRKTGDLKITIEVEGTCRIMICNVLWVYFFCLLLMVHPSAQPILGWRN